ncbi:glycosyltransferase [Streptomyces sp. NPDC017936]|uniref:glycosyltransferase n=1 Tax=Streptomyces sp. NPDC017936 TaxID=3365016 RepID=UPI00379C69AB
MRRPRVLWIPYAQRGSLYPVVPAVRALGALGAETMLLGLPRLADLAADLGTGFMPYEAESGISYDWSRPDGRDRHGLGPDNGADWFHDRVAAEYAQAERAVRDFRPDVVLTDSFVIGAGLAAEGLGVPWASYVHYLFDEGAETDDMHRVWWERPGTPALDAYCAWWDGVRAAVGLGPEPRDRAEAPWFRMSPRLTFLLGHPGLRRGDRALPGFVTRTSLPPWDEAPRDADGGTGSLAVPADRRRVLVANSSAWQDDIALVSAALEGLADTDVEIVATVSADHRLGMPLPANATVLGYHPHTRLVPAVDAVITTSGYGIVSKALWFGKPLVTVSHARDQHYVAQAVRRQGCGIALDWPPRPEALARAVREVLADTALHERLRRLSGPLAGHPSAKDVAADLLSLAGGDGR